MTEPTDNQIDEALRTTPGLWYDPEDSYPDHTNHALRIAYRAGYEAARCTCPHISEVDDDCPEHGRDS